MGMAPQHLVSQVMRVSGLKDATGRGRGPLLSRQPTLRLLPGTLCQASPVPAGYYTISRQK